MVVDSYYMVLSVHICPFQTPRFTTHTSLFQQLEEGSHSVVATCYKLVDFLFQRDPRKFLRSSTPLTKVDVVRNRNVVYLAEALVSLRGVIFRTVWPLLVKKLQKSITDVTIQDNRSKTVVWWSRKNSCSVTTNSEMKDWVIIMPSV